MPPPKGAARIRIRVHGPYGQSEQGVKRGRTDTGKQRSRCQTVEGAQQSFRLERADKGRRPEVKRQVRELSLKGSGISDAARVLQISPTTGIQEVKKKGRPSRR